MEQQNMYSPNGGDLEVIMVAARKKGMATMAMFFGIASIVTGLMGIFYIALPSGGMAAIIACLSRGKENLSGKAQVGFITGIIGIVLTLFIVISVVMMYFRLPFYRNMVNEVYKQNMGITLDEYIEQSVTEATGQKFDIDAYFK